MKLLELLKMPTEELMGRLREMKDAVSGKECILFKPKSTKPKVCLVCHTDTFFKPREKTIFHDKEKGVLWSPDGLGADDRAGVYACLKLYEEIPEPYKPMVLFCDEEETGGLGAVEACTSAGTFKSTLSNVLFFIELDRRGAKDCVFYNHEPRQFIRDIEFWGYKKARGTYTDISIICNELRICGVNLSIGYYREHSRAEYLVISEMENSIAKVKKILIEGEHKKWGLPKRIIEYVPLDFEGILDSLEKGERYYGKSID